MLPCENGNIKFDTCWTILDCYNQNCFSCSYQITIRTLPYFFAYWSVRYSLFLQVGIPVAAGTLLPVTGTMLSPSIAGALMGLSSIGVMSNSLLLRLRFKSIEKDISRTSLYVKAPSNADNTGNKKARLQQPYPAAR